MPTATKESPRCLIVDDHPVVRAGVRAVLEGNWEGATITDAESVDDVRDATNGAPPDVVIVDP